MNANELAEHFLSSWSEWLKLLVICHHCTQTLSDLDRQLVVSPPLPRAGDCPTMAFFSIVVSWRKVKNKEKTFSHFLDVQTEEKRN